MTRAHHKSEGLNLGSFLFQTMCYVVPVKDIRNLGVNWSIPDLHEYYKTNVSFVNICTELHMNLGELNLDTRNKF